MKRVKTWNLYSITRHAGVVNALTHQKGKNMESIFDNTAGCNNGNFYTQIKDHAYKIMRIWSVACVQLQLCLSQKHVKKRIGIPRQNLDSRVVWKRQQAPTCFNKTIQYLLRGQSQPPPSIICPESLLMRPRKGDAPPPAERH
jgi:hypothetical protein